MHPKSISYRGADYSLLHLRQSIRAFEWTSIEGDKVTFDMRVRFSNHCYSREIKPPATPEIDDVIVKDPRPRVFCTKRHGYTPDLVKLIDGLFAKPTATVFLTAEKRNWHIFQLYARAPEAGTDRYCIFFRMKKGQGTVEDSSPFLDLFIESAYVRNNRVNTIKRLPFGKAVELTWKGEKYF